MSKRTAGCLRLSSNTARNCMLGKAPKHFAMSAQNGWNKIPSGAGSKMLLNVRTYLPNYTARYPRYHRILQSSSTPLGEGQTSQEFLTWNWYKIVRASLNEPHNRHQVVMATCLWWTGPARGILYTRVFNLSDNAGHINNFNEARGPLSYIYCGI